MAIREHGSEARVELTRKGRQWSVAWGGPFVLGLIVALIGASAIVAAGWAGLATIFALGMLLVVAGAFEIGGALTLRTHGRFTHPFLSGVMTLVLGGLVLYRPGAGLAAVSLMLAAYFFASGLFRGIAAITDRYAAWGWDVLYGVTAIVLGWIVMAEWPGSSLWLVGTLVGVDLLFRGLSLMVAALTLRTVVRELQFRA